jgi:hypothetical protein
LRWIDRQGLAGVEIDEPGELHERAASGVEDHSLDVVALSLDPMGLSPNQGYLGCGWHVTRNSGPRRERLEASRPCRVVLGRNAVA